ncbi:nascent polypeptide-associated complex subunit alpha, muscle-specific form-like [Grus americana]|uniref:nascent polypeptide-associated complex subunit alpha, muscle-specific form-like n=1 Tax=Grus americana TaxID=9117 RepID=UPI002407942C|nr:nascent polypeptide-associated complex subunit alpha, muscle-specific form-like [Grus americana]
MPPPPPSRGPSPAPPRYAVPAAAAAAAPAPLFPALRPGSGGPAPPAKAEPPRPPSAPAPTRKRSGANRKPRRRAPTAHAPTGRGTPPSSLPRRPMRSEGGTGRAAGAVGTAVGGAVAPFVAAGREGLAGRSDPVSVKGSEEPHSLKPACAVQLLLAPPAHTRSRRFRLQSRGYPGVVRRWPGLSRLRPACAAWLLLGPALIASALVLACTSTCNQQHFLTEAFAV